MATPAETIYNRTQNADGRIKKLVIEHLPLVKRVVDRVLTSLPPSVSEDDVIGAGTLGLVESAHRFDASRGVKFGTFAYQRIRGAVMDFLRTNDCLGKAARARVSELRRNVHEFQRDNGRKPTIEELAQKADVAEDDILQYMGYEKWDHIASLDNESKDAGGEENVLKELIQGDSPTPLDVLERKERVAALITAIGELPERERQIIVMYYYEELYMAEMAEVLNISESRVSQIHTHALYNLSRKLEAA